MSTPFVPIADGDASTAEVAAFERDRRELLRGGLVLGATAIAASSVPLLLSARSAFAATTTDSEILVAAIKLEQVAVLVYDAAIASGLLSKDLLAAATLFRGHEQSHADVLSTALSALGETLPPKATQADVGAVVKGLGDASSQADLANVAIELELAAVAAYYDAEAKLVDAKLLQTGAAIMANESQHLVVLRQFVKRAAVPNAFETGAT